MAETVSLTGLLRLLHLVSPTLPVGAYAYSHGLEYAVEAGWVGDEGSAQDWIIGLLETTLGCGDIPVLQRLYEAWHTRDREAVEHWNAFSRALRETTELAGEDHHLGSSLARLLVDLDVPEAAVWMEREHAAYGTLFALAAARWRIPPQEALAGYLWGWADNQVAAAIRLVPLGQTAGQRILVRVLDVIPCVVQRALSLTDGEIGQGAPGLVLASSLHETQYSRLFRS